MTSLLFLVAVRTSAVTLPALFSDHMVLQRDRPVRVWGWGTPGDSVKVSIDKWSDTVQVGSEGNWVAWVPAHKAGGPYVLTAGGREFKDVLYGDVWVCSGQSNMQWSVAQSNNADQEIAGSANTNIRLFTVPMTSKESPLASNGGPWEVCGPQSVRNFSAVGYFYGRELVAKTSVPVGLINTSWGGTPVESWTSRSALMRVPESKAWLEDHLTKVKAGTQGNNAGWFPGALYNAMIAPLTPFGIRGAIWYQGESNADKPELYSRTFPNMIRDWRSRWNQGDFPFYFVQLASFGTNADWPRLREAQTKTLSVGGTGMALAIDIGTSNDIHPKNKQDVGKRLALWALRDVHGQDVEVSGPMFASYVGNGRSIFIAFTHGAGLKSRDGGPILGFQIAGEDKRFVDATATIVSGQVEVSASGVSSPRFVRYAWASDPKNNLVNAAGLPAVPFRTDKD